VFLNPPFAKMSKQLPNVAQKPKTQVPEKPEWERLAIEMQAKYVF